MAPEQARQKPIDRRVDIWAFGCVVFEMLTAQAAFTGDTPSDVLVRVIEHEPRWESLPVTTPAAIRRLLHRCLEKSAKQRLDSAAAARLEIDEAESDAAPVMLPTLSPDHQGGHRRSITWAAAGAGAALILTLVATDRARPPVVPRSLVATSVAVNRLNLGQSGVHFAVAPDGRTVVFSDNYSGVGVVHRRDLDRVDPEPIVGTEGGSDVFVSHDGRHLGFERGSELWTVPLDGGTPQRLLANQPLRGGTWGEDDRIVFGRFGSGIWMVSAAGGNARQLTRPGEGERHELPQLLPGGRAVLFTILATNRPSRVAAYLVETGETRALFEGIGARFVGSGHVVFGRQGRLWAAGFDPDALEVRGDARPVRDDVLWSAAGYPQFTVGADLLAYVRTSKTSSQLGNSVPVLVDRQGNVQPLRLKAQNYLLGRLSPAGDRLVVQVGAARELWTFDLRRGGSTKLTSDRIVAYSAPLWSPDATRVIFTTWFDGEVGLAWTPADGSGPVEALVRGVGMRSFESTHPVMLPDGSGVILTGLAPGASTDDLLFIPLNGEKRLESLLQAPGLERNPAISPNGRFVAYNSDETGRPEVYVRPFPGVGARRWPVSTDGGAGPVWTRGGTELVYRDSLGRIMAVTVQSHDNDQLDFSKPEPLFSFGSGMGAGLDRGFDVTADGERFLFFVPEADKADGRAAAELILIQNWTDELTRLVPPSP
jgi:serine/threonine-protein kinase